MREVQGVGHKNGLINQVGKFEIGPESHRTQGSVLLGTVIDRSGL